MSKIRIIINRQKAAHNRKFKARLPEEPTISIHDGNEIDYAYGVQLTGEWNIIQDYAKSPCSGAHIWLESVNTNSEYVITHREPQSETASISSSVDAVEDASDDRAPSGASTVEFF